MPLFISILVSKLNEFGGVETIVSIKKHHVIYKILNDTFIKKKKYYKI